MQALLTYFVGLGLLRRSPQQLPPSQALFVLVLLADLVSELLLGMVAGLSWWLSLLQGGAQIVLMLLALQVGLGVVHHKERFLQTSTALLGVGALIALLAIVPLGFNPTGHEQTDLAALGALLFLVLVVWNIVITGHILRHAFEITLAQGAALTIAFEVVSIPLIGLLFGGH